MNSQNKTLVQIVPIALQLGKGLIVAFSWKLTYDSANKEGIIQVLFYSDEKQAGSQPLIISGEILKTWVDDSVIDDFIINSIQGLEKIQNNEIPV